jgi:N utilization substance protein A
MTKKKVQEVTDVKKVIIDSVFEFKDRYNVSDREMEEILKEVLRTIIQKRFGDAVSYFSFVINLKSGDLEIYRNRKVVKDTEVEDESFQISWSEARKLDIDYALGEEVSDVVEFPDFDRREIKKFKDLLLQKLEFTVRRAHFEKYKKLEGEVISAEVFQSRPNDYVLRHEGVDMILPKSEVIPKDHLERGNFVRVYVKEVRLNERQRTLDIILSRTAPQFLAKLFEEEIPEVKDGIIEIVKVVREPGERAKVLVRSYDDKVDPVGACVGTHGTRIHPIVRELRNENIDVIPYTKEAWLLIQRALSPAHVTRVEVDEERKKAIVYLPPEEIPAAVGKKGVNIRLASQLTGYYIHLQRDSELLGEEIEDVPIQEFADEIPEEYIQKLLELNYDTARKVLSTDPQIIQKYLRVSEEQIKKIYRILAEEFEEDEE